MRSTSHASRAWSWPSVNEVVPVLGATGKHISLRRPSRIGWAADSRSLSVVVTEVFSQLSSGCCHTFIFGHAQFCLDRFKARFHQCVAIAVSRAAHTLLHLGTGENSSIAFSCVLAATVGVMNQPHPSLSCFDRFADRIHGKFFSHVVSKTPFDDLAAIAIH